MKTAMISLSKSDLQDIIKETIDACLRSNNVSQSSTLSEDQSPPLNVQQAAEFLNTSTLAVYNMVYRRQIPSMKVGKRVYFLKKDLIEVLKTNRRKTNAEIETETEAYLSRNKTGR